MAFIDFIEFTAICITYMFYISPIKKTIEVCRTMDTSSIPYLLYLFAVFNCNSWSVYGLQIKAAEIWLSNMPGSILFTIFIFLSILFRPMKDHYKFLLIIGISIFYGGQIYFFYNFVPSGIVGFIALISNILMNLTPIHQIYQVIKYNSNEYIDLWIASAIVINSCAWMTYAILANMINIFIPSCEGFIVAVSQIIVWSFFENNYKLQDQVIIINNIHENKDYVTITKEII